MPLPRLPETFTEADGHLTAGEGFTSGWGNLLALPWTSGHQRASCPLCHGLVW